jgi:hypothetical protein
MINVDSNIVGQLLIHISNFTHMREKWENNGSVHQAIVTLALKSLWQSSSKYHYWIWNIQTTCQLKCVYMRYLFSYAFPIHDGLNKGNVYLHCFLNCDLEYAIRKVSRRAGNEWLTSDIYIFQWKFVQWKYKYHTELWWQASREIYLQVNIVNSKYINMI